jgi:hypothetical protein
MDRGWLIVCGTIVFILLFNFGILVILVGRGGRERAARWGKAMRDITNPWREEDEAFAELNHLVRNFNADDHRDRNGESR